MNKVVINGIQIVTRCKYVKFTESDYIDFTEDIEQNNFVIKFPKGAKAKYLSNDRIKVIEPDAILLPTPYIRIYNSIIDINGLKMKVLAPYEYKFNQYIVKGIEKFYMDYNYDHCTILIPDFKDALSDEYIEVLKKNPYLELLTCKCSVTKLTNVYGIQAYRNNITINSVNSFTFNLKDNYTRYILRDVDCVHSFITQVKSIAQDYGIQVVKYPIDETAQVTDRLVYKIADFGKQITHKSGFHVLKDETKHRTQIEFEGTFLNNTILNDFRNRYQNLDLLSNFTEFYTEDKRGDNWVGSVFWSPITTDWTADFSQDNQGNSGVTCNFSCEIEYYVVYDRYYTMIREIIANTMYYPMGSEEDKDAVIESRVTEVTNNDNKISFNNPVFEDTESHIDEWLKLRNQN